MDPRFSATPFALGEATSDGRVIGGVCPAAVVHGKGRAVTFEPRAESRLLLGRFVGDFSGHAIDTAFQVWIDDNLELDGLVDGQSGGSPRNGVDTQTLATTSAVDCVQSITSIVTII